MSEELVRASANLSRVASAAWDEFIAAHAQYVARVKDECVQSPLDTLPVAQGRAQQAARTHELLATCRVTADRIAARKTQAR